MRALICTAKDQLEIADVRLDPPRQGEVRVRIAACGVCHSDLSVLNGTLRMRLPVVLGHEGAGIVEEVGPDVADLAVGDKVVLAWVLPCGACFYCQLGRPNLCEVGDQINRTNRLPDGSTRHFRGAEPLNVFSALGALAEEVVVPARAAVKVPADTALQTAALLGCAVTTGVGAVLNSGDVRPGSTVAVFGAGGVGLNAIQAARIAGAARIVAVDVSAPKLALAKHFGATDVAEPAAALDVIRALTQGRGADTCIEAVGRKDTIELAWAATRKAGTCVVVGLGSGKDSIALNAFLIPATEKKLVGSWYGSADVHRDIPRLLQLHQHGQLKLNELVTRTYTLAEAPQAFADLASGSNARGVIVNAL